MSNKIYNTEDGQLSFLAPENAGRQEYEGGSIPRPKPTPRQILVSRQSDIDKYWRTFEDFVRAAGDLAKFYKPYSLSLDDNEDAGMAVQKILTQAQKKHGVFITPEEFLRRKCRHVAWELIKLYRAAQTAKMPGEYRYIDAKDFTQQILKRLLESPPKRSDYYKELRLVETFCFCKGPQRRWLYSSFFPKIKGEHASISVEDVAEIFRHHIKS